MKSVDVGVSLLLRLAGCREDIYVGNGNNFKKSKGRKSRSPLHQYNFTIEMVRGVVATPAALNSIDLNESSGRATVFCSE